MPPPPSLGVSVLFSLNSLCLACFFFLLVLERSSLFSRPCVVRDPVRLAHFLALELDIHDEPRLDLVHFEPVAQVGQEFVRGRRSESVLGLPVAGMHLDDDKAPRGPQHAPEHADQGSAVLRLGQGPSDRV
jgi:hypothetical protein